MPITDNGTPCGESLDHGPRSARSLDLRGLIPQEDQRRFAEIYVSAFLDVVLKGDRRYLPMFRDHRVIGGWLPETMYITRFETSAFRPLATFEEDIDVTSGSHPGVSIRGDSLATWKESILALRSNNRDNTSASQENQAVILGWNNRLAGTDTARHGPSAVYTLEMPPDLPVSWELNEAHSLDFMLGPTNNTPSPRLDPGAESSDSENSGRGPEADTSPPQMDLSIELIDIMGASASVVLSEYGAMRRPLETYVMRRADLERDRFEDHWELILQTFSIPLSDFVATNRSLDLRRLRAVRFVFDRVHAGGVAIDQIGFSALDPAFLSARVEGPR